MSADIEDLEPEESGFTISKEEVAKLRDTLIQDGYFFSESATRRFATELCSTSAKDV